MDREYRWPFRGVVRFRCRTCEIRTHWSYIRSLSDLGETVDPWQTWWEGLHSGLMHSGEAVRR